MVEIEPTIVTRRPLHGQHPNRPEEIIARLEATANGGNGEPTLWVLDHIRVIL